MWRWGYTSDSLLHLKKVGAHVKKTFTSVSLLYVREGRVGTARLQLQGRGTWWCVTYPKRAIYMRRCKVGTLTKRSPLRRSYFAPREGVRGKQSMKARPEREDHNETWA